MNLSEFVERQAVDAAGNIYIVGTTNVTTNQQYTDVLVQKYSPSGQRLWTKTFDGTAHSQDLGFDIAVGGGYAYVVGRTLGATSSSDIVTIKLRASDGEFEWTRTFDGPANSVDDGRAIAVDSAGNVFVTGEVWNDAEYWPNGDYVTLKYSPSGELLWSTLYDGPASYLGFNDQPNAIAVDKNGDVVVSGNSPNSNNTDNFLTVKYANATGQQLWVARYEIGSNNYQRSLEIAANNDVIISGNSSQFGHKIVLIRYEANSGAPLWTSVNEFPHDGQLGLRGSMGLDPNDNPIITFDYDPDFDDSNLNDNVRTVKYDFATGNILYNVSYGTSATYDAQDARAIAVDRYGIAHTVLKDDRTGSILRVLSYSPSGQLIGNTSFVNPFGGRFEVRHALMDPLQNLVIAGMLERGNVTDRFNAGVLKFYRSLGRSQIAGVKN